MKYTFMLAVFLFELGSLLSGEVVPYSLEKFITKMMDMGGG